MKNLGDISFVLVRVGDVINRIRDIIFNKYNILTLTNKE